MKIIRMKLTNFLTYDGVKEFEFDEGVVLISGMTGSGKSTVIKAHLLNVYDTVLKSLEDYLNWNDATEFEVFEEFEHHGVNYKSTVSYRKTGKVGKTSRTLIINDDLENSINDTSSVNKYIKSIFDPIIQNISISSQNEQSFLLSSSTSRRENLKKVFNTDFKDRAKEIEDEYKKVDVSIQVLEKEIYSLQNKEYVLKDLVALLYSDDEIADFNKSIESIKLEISKMDELIKNELENDKVRKELNDSIDFNTKKIDKLKSSILVIEAYQPEEEIKKSNDLISENIIEINSINQQITEKQSKILEIQELISSAEKNLSGNLEVNTLKYNELISNIKLSRIAVVEKSSYESIRDKISDKKSEIKGIELIISDCKSGKCPKCKKDFDSSDHAKYDSEIKLLQNELQKLDEEYNTAYNAYTDYLKLVEDNNKAKNDIEVLKTQKDKEENEITNTNKKLIQEEKNKIDQANNFISEKTLEISKIDHTNKTFKEKIDVLNKISEENLLKLEEFKTDLSHYLSNTNSIKEKISKIPSIDTSGMNSQKFILNSNIEEINKKLSSNQDIVDSNVAIEQYNKIVENNKIEDKKTADVKISTKIGLSAEYERLKIERDILLKDFPAYVTGKLISSIENSMNTFIDKVYIKPLDVEITEDGDAINVMYGTGTRKIDCILASGSESQVLSLAYKDAVGKYFDNDFMLLDEVDSNGSVEICTNTSNVLFDMIKEDYEQIIVITHSPEAKEIYSINGAQIIEI